MKKFICLMLACIMALGILAGCHRNQVPPGQNKQQVTDVTFPLAEPVTFTFMIEGTIQKVSNLIYLMTPKDVEIQNDVTRKEDKQKASFSWLK